MLRKQAVHAHPIKPLPSREPEEHSTFDRPTAAIDGRFGNVVDVFPGTFSRLLHRGQSREQATRVKIGCVTENFFSVSTVMSPMAGESIASITATASLTTAPGSSPLRGQKPSSHQCSPPERRVKRLLTQRPQSTRL